MSDQSRTPMDLLKALSPAAAKAYYEHKIAIMESQDLSALSEREKLLVGIGVAAALQSSVCTLMWTKLARRAGIGGSEIAEAVAVSSLLKAATVNDTASDAISWLLNEGRSES